MVEGGNPARFVALESTGHMLAIQATDRCVAAIRELVGGGDRVASPAP